MSARARQLNKIQIAKEQQNLQDMIEEQDKQKGWIARDTKLKKELEFFQSQKLI
jgi:hypothetical protein